VIIFLILACQLDVPPPKTTSDDDASSKWKALLMQASGPKGVDYEYIKNNRNILDEYVHWVGTVGPQTNRKNRNRWPRSKRSDRHLTFYANAYNAWVIYSVLEHMPISSVQDVDIGIYTQENVGFFFGQRFFVDGEHMSLYHLEKERLLGNFHEPLIHVMLNCASVGCPALQYWNHNALTKDAETAMISFLNSESGARKTSDGFEVSELFSWYENDFVQWSDAEDLCQYIQFYAQGELATWLINQEECKLTYFSYDWSLNNHSFVAD
jgi:hypothetical protein